MLRRLLIPFLAVFLSVSAVSAVADALVVTEAERLEQLADSLVDETPGRRLDGLLRHVAPDREDLEVSADGRRRTFAHGEEVEAAEALRAGLDFVEQSDLHTVQETVTLDGADAVVALRLRASGEVRDVTLHLRHHDDRWLASRIVIR